MLTLLDLPTDGPCGALGPRVREELAVFAGTRTFAVVQVQVEDDRVWGDVRAGTRGSVGLVALAPTCALFLTADLPTQGPADTVSALLLSRLLMLAVERREPWRPTPEHVPEPVPWAARVHWHYPRENPVQDLTPPRFDIGAPQERPGRGWQRWVAGDVWELLDPPAQTAQR